MTLAPVLEILVPFLTTLPPAYTFPGFPLHARVILTLKLVDSGRTDPMSTHDHLWCDNQDIPYHYFTDVRIGTL